MHDITEIFPVEEGKIKSSRAFLIQANQQFRSSPTRSFHAQIGTTRPEQFRLARASEKISKKSLSHDTKVELSNYPERLTRVFQDDPSQVFPAMTIRGYV